MPTATFYTAVSAQLGSALSRQEQKFVAARGCVNEYETALDAVEREQAVSGAAELVNDLRASFGETLTFEQDTERLAGLNEGRWGLLTELRRYRGTVLGESDSEPPGHLTVGRGMDITCYPVAHHVTVTVDSGIPLKTLIAALRALWPQMREHGYLRRTRAMDEKSVELVRFVCLKQPVGTPWRQRLAAWNSAYPERKYKEVRAFEKDFSRAETSISGSPGGLDWFYDADARELSNFKPGKSDIEALSPGARKKLDEKLAELLDAPFWDHLKQEALKNERTPE